MSDLNSIFNEEQQVNPAVADATAILASYGANALSSCDKVYEYGVCDSDVVEDNANNIAFMKVMSLYNDDDTKAEVGDCLVLKLREEEHAEDEADDWMEDYYPNLQVICKFKLNKELDFAEISLANVRDYIVLPYTDDSTQKKIEAVSGGLTLYSFAEMHTDDAGIDGIISNISEVKWFADKVVMLLNFASGKDAKSSSLVLLNLDFYDPSGSYKVKEGTHGLHVSRLNDTHTTNVRLCYKGSSIAIETFVFAAAIWEFAKKADMRLLPSYRTYCADVLDASGSKASRRRYGLKYNISINNLELVFRHENCRRNAHKME